MSGTDLRVTLRYDGSELDRGLQGSQAQLQQWSQYICVPMAQNLEKVGHSASFSGEKMAKFGLVTASVTGALGNLPIKGEAVGKVFGIIGDLAAGAVNPIYLVAGAVGSAATAYALLAGKREADNKKLTEANDLLRENIDLTLRKSALEGGKGMYSNILGATTGVVGTDIAKTEKDIADLKARLEAGGVVGTALVRRGGLDSPSRGMAVEKVFQADTPEKIRELQAEVIRLTAVLDTARESQLKLLGWGREQTQAPEDEDSASYYRRMREKAEKQQEEAEQAALARKRSRALYGDGWKSVDPDNRARGRYALGGEGGPMEIPSFLRDSIGKTSEDVRKREQAQAEKTRAIYDEQINALRGTLDSMFGAAWQNAGKGFDKMVQEMAKAAMKHLGWFFLQKGLDAAVPGIGSLLGWSPAGGSGSDWAGPNLPGDSFGAGATARANMARRAARA